MALESIVIVCLLFVGTNSIQYDESELSQLPKLFHLDDYERCLDQPGGVYCLGQFQVYSDGDSNPTYDLIQKYSQDSDLYNRSYVHRGYCLTSRCAGADANLSARFERCVDKWARHRHGLRARLHTLHYCKEHDKLQLGSPDTQDTAHRVFVYVLLIILILNVIGTAYDMNVEENVKTEKFRSLRLWSIRKNWNSLTGPGPEDREVGLDTMNGIKGIMALTPMYLHANIFLAALYQQNPRFMEKFLLSPAGPMIGALTTPTQAHLVISYTLTSYKVLSTKEELTWKKIIKFVLKRLTRILPVYLLVVGFAATWWTSAGSGPHWYLVEHESSVCRDKFWVMAAFLQNLVEPEKICLVQTWILAVDMQVHIPVLVVTWLLMKCRRWALTIIGALFAAASAFIVYVAFKNDYVPFYIYSTPENFRLFFDGNKSFMYFFVTPANCIMATVLALWVAFYHKGLKERGGKFGGRLVSFVSYVCIASVYVWAYWCYFLKMRITDPRFITSMLLIERLFYSLIMGTFFIFMMNSDNWLFKFLRWERFRVISRMSLSISMVHWCVNGIIVGNRYLLSDSSVLNLYLDTLSTFTVSCVVALPLTIMVEYPLTQILNEIISK